MYVNENKVETPKIEREQAWLKWQIGENIDRQQ